MASRKAVVSPSDLRGLSRLVVDAATGLTDLVEQTHHTILRAPAPSGAREHGPAGGAAGLVYRGIRGAMRLAGAEVDAALGQLGPPLRTPSAPAGATFRSPR